jgi:hypothetical protein
LIYVTCRMKCESCLTLLFLLLIEWRLCFDGVDWLFLFVSCFLIGSFSESVYWRRTDNTMAKRKSTKDKQRPTKHIHKTKDRVTHRVKSLMKCESLQSIGCFFLYPAFWLVLFPGFWLANRPEMVTSDWSDFLAVHKHWTFRSKYP